MELTDAERMSLGLIQEQADVRTTLVLREVERRLGLPSGSIGRTHAVDMASGRVLVKSPDRDCPPNGHQTVTNLSHGLRPEPTR